MARNKKISSGNETVKKPENTLAMMTNGKEMYKDVDVEKGRRFPPSQEEGCYYEEQ